MIGNERDYSFTLAKLIYENTVVVHNIIMLLIIVDATYSNLLELTIQEALLSLRKCQVCNEII